MAGEKLSPLDALIKGLKALLPVLSIIGMAYGAIHTIEQKANEAIEKVAASVANMQVAQARHEALDDERQKSVENRLSHVESRQDGMEQALVPLGVDVAIDNRRRYMRAGPGSGR